MEKRTISGDEYKSLYMPVGAWVLIEKDVLPSKTAGGIHLPTRARENDTKLSMTGTIVAKGPFKKFDNEVDAEKYSILAVGDRVGFADTTPIISPAPPDCRFSEDCDNRFVTMHISDILMIFLETDAKRREFTQRFGG